MYEEFVSSIQTMIESAIAEINTSTPATIVSYDAAKNRAVVKLDMPRRLADDVSLAPPNVVEVPIVWTASGGGKSTLTMPIKPGDGVMLSFQQRSLEGWLSGNKSMPDDPRQFDLSDCVAIPGCQPSGIVADPDDVVLKFDKAQFRMKPDGTVIVGNDKGSMQIDPDGSLVLKVKTIRVETAAKTFNMFEEHKHEKTKSDPTDISGPPKSDTL